MNINNLSLNELYVTSTYLIVQAKWTVVFLTKLMDLESISISCLIYFVYFLEVLF